MGFSLYFQFGCDNIKIIPHLKLFKNCICYRKGALVASDLVFFIFKILNKILNSDIVQSSLWISSITLDTTSCSTPAHPDFPREIFHTRTL
jgi:hypothetical protein